MKKSSKMAQTMPTTRKVMDVAVACIVEKENPPEKEEKSQLDT